MADLFPLFDVTLKKRSRGWSWSICTTKGKVLMIGSELSRPAARYKANSALFLLLLSARPRPLPHAPMSRERGFARQRPLEEWD
jgi:hypothetical protein